MFPVTNARTNNMARWPTALAKEDWSNAAFLLSIKTIQSPNLARLIKRTFESLHLDLDQLAKLPRRQMFVCSPISQSVYAMPRISLTSL